MSKYLEPKNNLRTPGRPLGIFLLSVTEVESKIEEWQLSFKKDGERWGDVPTLSALAYDLGITSVSLSAYSHRDDYRPLLERAKTFCEMHSAQALFDPKIRPGGPIFNLKHNHGWKDGTENKGININFNWNTVQIEAEKARKLLEDPDYVPDITDIE